MRIILLSFLSLLLGCGEYAMPASIIATPSPTAADQTSTNLTFTIQLRDTPSSTRPLVNLRRWQSTITAIVLDEIVCTTVDTDVDQPPTVILGAPGQPAVCSQAGVTVTLHNLRGRTLSTSFTIRPGATVTLDDYALLPATANPPRATSTERPPATFEGLLVLGFERSAFYLAAVCPGATPADWLETLPESGFAQDVLNQTGIHPFAGPDTLYFNIRVIADRSGRGVHGHLGRYPRQLTVHELLAAEIASVEQNCDAEATDNLNAARARWASAAITRYYMRIQHRCECPPEWTAPISLQIEDAIVLSSSTAGHTAPEAATTTVDDLFVTIASALAAGLSTQVTYHETLGYPLEVQLNLEAVAGDRGTSLTVLALEPLG